MKIKITANPCLILKKKKFILAAFNLAFISLFLEKKIKINNFFIMWNDGIIGSYISKLRKIPGRNVIDELIYNNSIKEVHVIGNISEKSKKYLMNKSQKKIKTHFMPIASIKVLKKKLPKIKKNNLYLITLPTPKQEKLAKYLSEHYEDYKIICIGGGLEMASGNIKKCPSFFEKLGLEFIWRLKEDTLRRVIRLSYTLIIFIKNIIRLKNINLKEVF